MPRLIYVVLSIITVAFMFSACAQDGKDGRNGIDLTAKEETAMSTRGCVTCHSDYKEVVAASGHMTKDTYLATNPTCLVCHSPDLGYLDIRTDDTYTGGVSCTGCHALDPKVKDNPIHSSYELTSDKCITCHGAVTGHEKYINPYATNIAADFGKIEDSYPGHSFASKKAIRDGDPRACGVCHSAKVFSNIANKVSPRIVTAVSVGGTTKYRTAGGPNEKMYANFPAYSASAKALHLDRAGSDAVGCDGCHQPHSTELLAEDVISTGTTVVASAEFLLCTSCHLANVEIESNGRNTVLSPLYTGAVDANGILTDKDADASLLEHHGLNFEGNPTHTILDTHFKGELYSKYSINEGKVKVDNATKISVEGYNIRAGSKNACTSCHNVHASSVFEAKKDDKTYQKTTESWAKSGHGLYTGNHGGATCQPCHNSNREYAYLLAGKTDKASLPADNLNPTCFTCHVADYERTADNATIITGVNVKKLRVASTAAEYKRVTPGFTMPDDQFAAIKTQFPQEHVMLCGTCHTLRYDTIAGSFTDNETTGKITVLSPHRSMAFASLTGFGFDFETIKPAGKTYASVGGRTSAHVKDGCLTCHTTNADTHTFDAFSDVARTQLTNTSAVCSSCHSLTIGTGLRDETVAMRASLAKIVTSASNGLITISNVPNPADRKQIGVAIGTLRYLGTANADAGLYAHMSQKLIQQLVYDSLFVLSSHGFTGVDFTSGIDFTNAKAMTTEANGLTQAEKDALTTYFLRFSR